MEVVDDSPAHALETRIVLYSVFRPGCKTLETFVKRGVVSDAAACLTEAPDLDFSVHWPSARCLSLFSDRVRRDLFTGVTMTALCASLYSAHQYDEVVTRMLQTTEARRTSPITLVLDAETFKGVLASPLWRLGASTPGTSNGNDFPDQLHQLLQWSFWLDARHAEDAGKVTDNDAVLSTLAKFVEDVHFLTARDKCNLRGALWSVDSPFRRRHKPLSVADGDAQRLAPCLRCAACYVSLQKSPVPSAAQTDDVPVKRGGRRRANPKLPHGGVERAIVEKGTATERAEATATRGHYKDDEDEEWHSASRKHASGSAPHKKRMIVELVEEDEEEEEEEEDDEVEEQEEEVEDEEQEDEKAHGDNESAASDVIIAGEDEDGHYDLTDDEEDDDDDDSNAVEDEEDE